MLHALPYNHLFNQKSVKNIPWQGTKKRQPETSSSTWLVLQVIVNRLFIGFFITQ